MAPGLTPVPLRDRGKGCKLYPRDIYDFYGRSSRINFGEGRFDWKLKVLVPFLRVKSHQRVTSHPNPSFPQMHLIKILRLQSQSE